MNLPKLEQQKMPYDRTEESVKFTIQQNLITPLNSINAAAVKVYEGKNHNIGYKTSMVISPDNTRWHFDNNGNLVGIEKRSFTTVYKRDRNQRVERIEGWCHDKKEGFIELEYSKDNKIKKAKGSDDSYVTYSYDEAGNLLKTESSENKRSYSYQDKKLTQILVNDKVINQFSYNKQGQIIKQVNGDKAGIAYETSVTDRGYRFVQSSGDKIIAVDYDAYYRPTFLQLPDKSTIKCAYNPENSLTAQLESATGEKYVMSFSANGGNRTLDLPEGGRLQSEFDENGRLLKIKKKEEVVLEQTWNANGILQSTQYGNTTSQAEYNNYGEPVRIITGIKSVDDSFKEWQEEVFNDNRQLVNIKDYSGKDMRFQYSKRGEVTAISANNHSINIDRNDNGSINKVKTSWGTYQNNSYKKEKIDKIEIGFGKNKSEINFIDGLLSHITQFDGSVWQFAYSDNPQGKLLCGIKSANELSFYYKYDKENRLSSVAVGDQYRIGYERDNKGRLIRVKYMY